jgi:hypothetical protein
MNIDLARRVRSARATYKVPIIVGIIFTAVHLPIFLGMVHISGYRDSLTTLFYSFLNAPFLLPAAYLAEWVCERIWDKYQINWYINDCLVIIFCGIAWVSASTIFAMLYESQQRKRKELAP